MESDKDDVLLKPQKLGNRIRKATMQWPEAKCLKLIKLVEELTCLWDTSDAEYKDRTIRENAWREIADQLHYPKDEINFKWSLLRQQFRNAHKKICKTKNGKLGPTEEPPNKFYNAMLFMASVLSNEPRVRRNSGNVPLSSIEHVDLGSQSIDFKYNENNWDENENSSTSSSFYKTRSPSPKISSKRKRRKIDKHRTQRTSSPPLSRILKKALDVLQAKDNDEYEIWGLSLAATIRNYPDTGAVRRFKAAVALNVAKLESGQFDSVTIGPKVETILDDINGTDD